MKTLVPLLLSAVLLMISCSRVSVSGRRQLHLLPESQLIGISTQQFMPEAIKYYNKG